MSGGAMSVRIAVCDDDASQLENMKRLLWEWDRDAEVVVYSSAEQFLFDYPDKVFDMLLLDVEMGRMNGMELAAKLREKNDEIPVIFISGYDEFIQRGYDVEAIHYLLKPIRKEKLFEVLDKCVRKGVLKSEDQILLPAEDGLRKIDSGQIICAEAFGKKTVITLKQGEHFDCAMGIQALSQKLGEEFIFCHRSYLINLKYLHSIGKNTVTMDNGETIPLSRRSYEHVNRAFLSYYKEKM